MRKYKVTTKYVAYTLDEVIDKKLDPENACHLIFSGDHHEEVDESCYIKDGKIKTSSYECGIIEWDEEKGQYKRMYHKTESPLGQLIEVVFKDTK